MSNFTVGGDINAGRDNVITVGDQQTYKPLDQMIPDELRREDQHSRQVSRTYRIERATKSKWWFILLGLGITSLGVIAFFVKEIFIDYTGGNTPNIQILMRFIWDTTSAASSPNILLIKFAGFIIFVLFTVLLPIGAIKNLLFHNDEFLNEEKNKRLWIKKRLRSLGEKA